MKSGLYQIRNKINGKEYIGSSVNIKHRWSVHKCYLNQGVHDNPHLQAAWNKYGADAFVFMIIEYCENYLEKEQYLLDVIDPEYNMSKVAGTSSRLGVKSSFEHKRKQSMANGQFTKEEVKTIIDRIIGGEPARVIGEDYGVRRKVVDHIKHNKTYKHVNYKREEARQSKTKSRYFNTGKPWHQNRYGD